MFNVTSSRLGHKTFEHDFCTQTQESTNQIAGFHISSMIFVLRALSKVLCLQGLDYRLNRGDNILLMEEVGVSGEKNFGGKTDTRSQFRLEMNAPVTCVIQTQNFSADRLFDTVQKLPYELLQQQIKFSI